MAKEKIVVLGGGCAALSAVFMLTEQDGWENRHEITVYQPGWRLGGKGAAGRNEKAGNRIEEHGLHVWSGFYENAFWMMRKVYRELARPSSHPLAAAFTAFRPRHYAALSNMVNGEWLFWKGYLPHDTGLPGDFIHPDKYDFDPQNDIRSPWQMLCEVVMWAAQYIESTTNAASANQPERSGGPTWLLDALLKPKAPPPWMLPRLKWCAEKILLGVILWRLLRAFRKAQRYHDEALKQGAAARQQQHTDGPYQTLADRMACLQCWFHRQLKSINVSQFDQRSFYIQADLFSSMMIGMLRDGVIAGGFDVIDDMDLRAWLTEHGAQPESLANATVDSAYSYVFSFENGDPDKPRLAAGVAIRLLMRLLLCSRGAVFWEMQGGMGDTIFAPLYEALRARGVKFKFFHRVTAIKSGDGKAVDEIVIGRQATLKQGLSEYAPLKTYCKLPGWPSAPRYDQLVEGAALAAKYEGRLCELESNYGDWEDREVITLRKGGDFDRVVLGISVEAVKFLCADLSAKNARFKQGVEGIKTVRTQSMQLWAGKSLYDLGWKLPPPIVCSYGEPFDTWADMSGLLEREGWCDGETPRSLAYFCGVMKDDACGILPPGPQPGYFLKAHEQAKENARVWLHQYTGELWPLGTCPRLPDLDYQILYRPGGGSDAQRFDYQWFSANVDLTARYVLALPGTTRLRLKAGESGFSNLLLAGDWVRNGLNYGCVESAVLGGFQAARAITGFPSALYGETDGTANTPFAATRPKRPALLAVVEPANQSSSARAAPSPANKTSIEPLIGDHVRRGGLDVLPAPWRCDDVQLDAFYLHGDLDALQALCDRMINQPSQGCLVFKPSTRHVVLTFQRLHNLRSLAPGCETLGGHTYCEAAFWVFTQRFDRQGHKIGDQALLIPYIFAENSVAVATGREVYGYPKEYATVGMPLRGAAPDDYTVRGLAVPVFKPGAIALPDTEILRCRRIDDSALKGLGHAACELAGDLLTAVRSGRIGDTALALVGESITALMNKRLDLVYLREIRALAGGRGCDIQSVTTASEHPLELECLRLLRGRYALQLPPLDSHPIAADLGLKLQAGNSVDVMLGLEIDLAFTLGSGKNLWSAAP